MHEELVRLSAPTEEREQVTSILVPQGDNRSILVKDGTMLSYVNTDDPTDFGGVLFPYMRVIADQVDQLPEGPLRVVHIGGGAMTLARYIEHTRPFSSQVVVEPDRDLIDMVEEQLPYDHKMIFTVAVKGEDYLRVTDSAQEDLVIMDAFDGYETPKALTTVECFDNVKRILKPGGVMIANVIKDWQLYTDTVARTFDEVRTVADDDVLNGEKIGNVIVVAR